MTPQRRAIVAEIMRTQGHISPTALARKVQGEMPGVNASTIYRTLSPLEEVGVLAHAHLESGAEYHRDRGGRPRAPHLLELRRRRTTCRSRRPRPLVELIEHHHGFEPDLTHFAISGLCADCARRPRGGPLSRRARRAPPRGGARLRTDGHRRTRPRRAPRAVEHDRRAGRPVRGSTTRTRRRSRRTSPTPTEIQSIRWKLSVSSRPITGGITSIAAISVTPSTFMHTVIIAVSSTASDHVHPRPSTRPRPRPPRGRTS